MEMYTIFIVWLNSVWKRILVQNLSDEDEFYLHKNEPVGGTHFHMSGFKGKMHLGLFKFAFVVFLTS